MPSSADGFRQIPRTDIPALWPDIWPILGRSVEHGDGSYAECDVMMALLAGQWQAWIYGDPISSICVTEVVTFPQQRKLIVRYVAGDLEPFQAHSDQLIGYAQAHNCNRIESNQARRGWLKAMPGWQQARVVIYREVEI